MSDGEDKAKNGRRVIFSLDSLNLIIAVSAVFISAASFVATYIQSDASLRQVKAETWPYLQIDSSNYNSDTREQIIMFEVENAGVGPANLKQFELYYEGSRMRNVVDFVKACCSAVLEEHDFPKEALMFTTDSPSPAIIPAGDKELVFSMLQTSLNGPLWTAIDTARWKLTAKGCYCSLLDECFETDFKAEPVAVNACQRNPDTEYNG